MNRNLISYLFGQNNRSIFGIGNRVLIILVTVLFGYVLMKYFSREEAVPSSTSSVATAMHKTPLVDIASLTAKPFKVYEKSIRERNLFEPLKSDLKPDPKILQKALPALHKRIKLIGILMDNDSKAIVEDLKEKQTHFLSKGESLGLVTLEDIYEDKVIFQYHNERVEMTP